MLNVMLIDDEYYVRQSIKIAIPWEDNGFHICGEAEDGEEAFNKLITLKPDIAFVDINMPIINGLNLIKKIKEHNIKTKIIILTGYNKFEYAKQAIELGTCCYLLKPIVESELLAALLDIKEVIIKEKYMANQINSLKSEAKKTSHLQKEKFLNKLICEKSLFQQENLQEKMEQLNIKIRNSNYRIIIIKIDNINEKGWFVRDKELWGFALKNICLEIINKIYSCELWFDYGDNLCCLLIDQKDITHNKLRDISNKIRILVYRLLDFTISIGIGNDYCDIENIKSSYSEAIFCLKNKILMGEDKTIFYSEIKTEENVNTIYYDTQYKEQLIYHTSTSNINGINEDINIIFDYLKNNKASAQTIYMYAYQLLSTAYEIITKNNIHLDGIIKDREYNYKEVLNLESIGAINNYIMDIFTEVSKELQIVNRTSSDTLVYQIKVYIKQNYYDSNLKIDNIVEHFNFNYHYLCKLFKQQTNSTIGDYILQVRMKKAKELISLKYSSVEIIAQKVGYSNANYFSKRFKKYYGLSPQKYINNNM
ncbi:MAG: response regulator [Vallitalea sp.]|nr:response regulator [Vallitalea sp.]